MDDCPKTDWCSSAHLATEVEALREKLLEVAGLSEIFKVLSDETRTRILYLLAQGELCTCDLADILGMSLPAISHHLRLLRMARLVRHRREGKNVYYALDDEHVLHIIREAQAHFREER
ncbi:MAG: Transcriptional repressor SmtB [Firmicutes bacterium]|nr:Transcriptional repressor SmtB [candidate division NPL-UPA2 bacterium]